MNVWNAQKYQENVSFVPDIGRPVLDLLAPQAGEDILDLGCGDGSLTQSIRDFGCNVLGIDSSEDMIRSCRARGLPAEQMDGTQLTFGQEFDAVFSNAALHWMKEPDAVINGVARALRPGGRFVGAFGGMGILPLLLRQLKHL